MIRYVSAIVDAHSYVAKDKAIELQLIKDKDTLLMDFDPEKIEIIVSNILSNAIKYTPPNGWIEVKLATENEDNTFVITIKDNGVGISEEEKQHVFDYFYRSESVLNMANSSGIGLTLTKKLIDIIHGQIEITSMVGAGTEVSIYIPITQQASYTEVDSLALNTTTEVYKEEGTFSTEKTERYKQYSILIVEDNDTLRELLKAQLGNYSIYAAEDGEKGEALALEILPDIIISDVMMPKKNGYELCKTLKAHPATSHIPIVLLTAKADQKSKLQGLETQADAYLYKPYDIKELELTLRNFIESRKKLYKRYRHLEKSLNDRPVDNREDKFIIELRTIIKANITDVDYGYKSLHEALNISKAQLYKKLKSLTGLSVGNYILLIRLQEAKKLLTETDLSIKEVTFSVGLTSQSYLSKKFKEEFNMTPSEWREGKVKGKTF
jgi:DNA-binding response OmpR family regulator/anti-sigma regulatory factor (Ser/Thr protein kinase)